MTEEDIKEKREELRNAYARLFCGNGTEPTKDARIVLDDLKRFCGFELSELAVSRRGTVDVNATMARIGQKEMFLRIVHLSNLSMQPKVQGEKDGTASNRLSRSRAKRATADSTANANSTDGIDRA
jgi:hypothetical protein